MVDWWEQCLFWEWFLIVRSYVVAASPMTHSPQPPSNMELVETSRWRMPMTLSLIVVFSVFSHPTETLWLCVLDSSSHTTQVFRSKCTKVSSLTKQLNIKFQNRHRTTFQIINQLKHDDCSSPWITGKFIMTTTRLTTMGLNGAGRNCGLMPPPPDVLNRSSDRVFSPMSLTEFLLKL